MTSLMASGRLRIKMPPLLQQQYHLCVVNPKILCQLRGNV